MPPTRDPAVDPRRHDLIDDDPPAPPLWVERVTDDQVVARRLGGEPSTWTREGWAADVAGAALVSPDVTGIEGEFLALLLNSDELTVAAAAKLLERSLGYARKGAMALCDKGLATSREGPGARRGRPTKYYSLAGVLAERGGEDAPPEPQMLRELEAAAAPGQDSGGVAAPTGTVDAAPELGGPGAAHPPAGPEGPGGTVAPVPGEGLDGAARDGDTGTRCPDPAHPAPRSGWAREVELEALVKEAEARAERVASEGAAALAAAEEQLQLLDQVLDRCSAPAGDREVRIGWLEGHVSGLRLAAWGPKGLEPSRLVVEARGVR